MNIRSLRIPSSQAVPTRTISIRQALFLSVIMLICAMPLAGCLTTEKSVKAGAPASGAESAEMKALNEGYSLLYRLVSDEGNVDKILIVKGADDPIKEFIKEMAATYRDAAGTLETLQKGDPSLDIKMDLVLPEVDEKSRGAIAFATAKELLGSSGEEFERRLLLTQVSATNYGTHLSRVLLKLEANPQRKAFLTNLANRCEDFHERVIQMLRVKGKGEE